ncbi:MAG: ribonuclease Z [Sphingobacteriia bacterium]
MFEVRILGTNSAIPAFGRYPTAQLLTHFGHSFLIDCGEGTQMQTVRYRVGLRNLTAICISHLHGDHVLGLPGLITSLSMGSRTQPLTLIGPIGLEAYVQFVLASTHSSVHYALRFHELEPTPTPQLAYETDRLEIYTLPLLHRIPTLGYLFREKPKPPKFLFFEAKKHDVPKPYMQLLKQGNPVSLEDGRIIQPEQVHAAPDPAYSYAFCSDTAYLPELVPHIQGVDVLYHEATFLREQATRAQDTLHSTAEQAAQIAQAAQVGCLYLGHYSARYRYLEPFLAEARPIFAHTYLAQEGLTIPIPAAHTGFAHE